MTEHMPEQAQEAKIDVQNAFSMRKNRVQAADDLHDVVVLRVHDFHQVGFESKLSNEHPRKE